MAGEFPGGNADAKAFRDGIHFAMHMGAPPVVDQQATFLFASQLVYNAPVDDSGVPFDPNATVTENPVAPVRVDCAVEFFDAVGQLIEFGSVISPSKVKITLLDVDYAKVKEAIAVVIGGDRYNYRFTEPPSGLFSVGLYILHFDAIDES